MYGKHCAPSRSSREGAQSNSGLKGGEAAALNVGPFS